MTFIEAAEDVVVVVIVVVVVVVEADGEGLLSLCVGTGPDLFPTNLIKGTREGLDLDGTSSLLELPEAFVEDTEF